MSDLPTSMGDDILQMIVPVCLRDGKEAVGHLKARYPEEANNVRVALAGTSRLSYLVCY